MRIDGVVAITGGAGHIGRAIAQRAAECGAEVALVDRAASDGEAVAEALTAQTGRAAAFVPLDLADPSAGTALRDALAERFGRLDGLVHNAAFYDRRPGWGVPYLEETPEAWADVLRVNLMAPFFLTQALDGLLRAGDGGSVVMVSSIYGVVGPDNRVYDGTAMVCPAAYAASKGGLIQLTRWLSASLAPGIRVNAVSPGGVERGQPESFQAAYRARTPMGRMGTEADMAGAAAFLLSDQAAYVTGQNIVVDGGWTAW